MSMDYMSTETITTIQFSETELACMEDFSKSIDLSNSTAIIEYGSDTQKKLSELSGRMLATLNSQSMEDITGVLNTTIGYLNSMEKEKEKPSVFKKRREISLRQKYREAEYNVNKATALMQQHQMQLMKDCALLNQMHVMNDVYYRELQVKIAAGKQKLLNCRQTDLPLLETRAKSTGLSQDTQAVADLHNQMDRLEKKLHELELTASISLQSAPLIRMIQSNQSAMATKIQSTLLNTIPLWKNQVVLALGMEQAKQMTSTEKQANEMMQALLNKNKESAKLASISTMEEASRNFADVASLESTNKQLIESLNEVAKGGEQETSPNAQ